VFEVLEKAFVQKIYIFASLYQVLQTSSAFVNEVPFGSSLSYFSIFAELLALKYKNKEQMFRLVLEIKPNYMTKYPKGVIKIGCRYLGTGNSFASLVF
jgi:hypothetical protein